VSCVDRIGNFISFGSSKFGYFLVNFIELKFQNYTVSICIYIIYILQYIYIYIRGETIIKLINLNMFVY